MRLVWIPPNIEIRLNSRDHRPIHVHVYEGVDAEALMELDGSVYAGTVSTKATRAAKAWVLANERPIRAAWKKVGNK